MNVVNGGGQADQNMLLYRCIRRRYSVTLKMRSSYAPLFSSSINTDHGDISACCCAIPYIRSQGFNAARELVCWQTQINKSCMDDWYGSLSATLEYTHSFHSVDLGDCLFVMQFVVVHVIQLPFRSKGQK